MMLWGICGDTIKLPFYKGAPKKAIWVSFCAMFCLMTMIIGLAKIQYVEMFVFTMFLGNFSLQFYNTASNAIITI